MAPERLTIDSGDLVDERQYRLKASAAGGDSYSQPATVRLLSQAPLAAWSLSRRLPFCRDYDGPLFSLYREAAPYETRDFYPTGPNDEVDLAAVRSWIGINRLTSVPNNWISLNIGGVRATPNQPSPDGRTDATLYRSTLASGTKALFYNSPRRAGVTDRYGFTIWMKAGTQRYVAVSLYIASPESSSLNAVFDLRLGRVVRIHDGGWGDPATKVADEGDGWFRCELIGTCPGDGSFYPAVSMVADTTTTALPGYGAGTLPAGSDRDFLVWRAQLQLGEYDGVWSPPCGGSENFAARVLDVYDQAAGSNNRARTAASVMTAMPHGLINAAEPFLSLNGRFAADFRDTQYLQAGATSTFQHLHTTGGTIYIAGQNDTTASIRALLSTQNGTTSNGFSIRASSGAGTVSVTVGQLDVAGVPTAGSSVNTNIANNLGTVPFVGIVDLDPDNGTPAARAKGYFNTLTGTGTNVNSGTPFVQASATQLRIGVRGSTEYNDGRIAEVVIWPDLLSATDRQLVLEDAAAFFGITLTP